MLEVNYHDGQDDAATSKEHPAVWYLRKLSQVRKKKFKDFVKLNKKKTRTKSKPNALKAAQRRLKKKKLEEAEEFSDEDDVETIDYDNMHLAFDQEKTHKFNC